LRRQLFEDREFKYPAHTKNLEAGTTFHSMLDDIRANVITHEDVKFLASCNITW